jgi:hypothetical protein
MPSRLRMLICNGLRYNLRVLYLNATVAQRSCPIVSLPVILLHDLTMERGSAEFWEDRNVIRHSSKNRASDKEGSLLLG